jgi:WD40 repeat protein
LTGASDWSRRELLQLHRDAVTCVAYATAGDNVVSVSADGHLKVYSVGTRKLIRSAKVSDMTLSSCAVTADGKQVYVASWDNSVSLYNCSFGRVVSEVQAHDDAVSAMSVAGASSGGTRMLTGSWDTTCRVFAVSESAIGEHPLRTFAEHDSAITAVALDGAAATAVSGGEDGSLFLWDVRAKEGHGRAIEGFADHCAVKSLAFAPEARWGASADFVVSAADGSLRHMDAGSGRILSRLAGPSSGAALNCVRTDGASVLSCGEDGAVRGWDLRTAEELLCIHTGLGSLVTLDPRDDAKVFAVANQKMAIFESPNANLA